jgi:hypothetical protein
MITKRMIVGLAALLGLAVTSQASAQSCNIAVTSCNVATSVSATVPTIAKLTLSTVSTTLNGPVDDLLDSVAVNTVGPSATVKANVGWHLQISSAANWTGTGSAGSKLVGDFSWATSVAGTYSPVTTTATNIVNSATGSKTTQPMFYAVMWRTSDAPGNYSLAVTYTLTTP